MQGEIRENNNRQLKHATAEGSSLKRMIPVKIVAGIIFIDSEKYTIFD
jgi:hypothetical protein